MPKRRKEIETKTRKWERIEKVIVKRIKKNIASCVWVNPNPGQ